MKFAVVILACVVAAANAQYRASAYASVNTGFGANNQYRTQQAYRPPQAVAVTSVFSPAPKPQAVAANKPYRAQQAYRPPSAVSVSPAFPSGPKNPAVGVNKPYRAQQSYKPQQSVSVTPVFPSGPKKPAEGVNKPYQAQQAYKPQKSVVLTPAFAPVQNAPAVAMASASYSPVQPARASAGDLYIVKQGNEINPDGTYNYFYETNNGIAVQEQGAPQNLGGNPPVFAEVAQGSYAYTSPEGVPIAITYTADKDGYHPQGDAIPTPPPVPPQIRRALEYIARTAAKH